MVPGQTTAKDFRHGEDSQVRPELLGYAEAQSALAREGPRVRQIREAYDLLLEQLGQPRIDPGHRDLFRYPKLETVLEKVLGSGRRSPIPDDRLRLEFLEELSELREYGIVELLPVLMVRQHELVCNEYVVFQARGENGPLPLKGYLETAVTESAREATLWLNEYYRVDLTKVEREISEQNALYIQYLPYYRIMDAYRTEFEEMLLERMIARKQLKARTFITILDRYGLHFLQPVYHRLTGTALHGSNPLTIGPQARSLARHPYAWSVASLKDHLKVFALLFQAFREKLRELDSVLGAAHNADFLSAYRDFLKTEDPDPDQTHRLIGSLFAVFGASLHGADFAFLRNIALEVFDHTATIADIGKEKEARERDDLVLNCARTLATLDGWGVVEDLVDPEALARVSNFAELLGDSSRTGVHLIRAAQNGRRVCTFAVHEANIGLLQKEAVRRARRGDFEWLEPLQALYRNSMESSARSTEALHHAVAAYYQSNQELLYWHSLPFWKRVLRRLLLFFRRKGRPTLPEMERAQQLLMRKREERLQKIERTSLQERGKRMARAALREPAAHPSANLPDRRGATGQSLARNLISFWESDTWAIPVTRELPGLLGLSMDQIQKKLGKDYQELQLRGNDRVVIPRSYLLKNRERIVQRINAYFLKHLDARGEILAAGLGPQEKAFLRKKVTFLENIRHALETEEEG